MKKLIILTLFLCAIVVSAQSIPATFRSEPTEFQVVNMAEMLSTNPIQENQGEENINPRRGAPHPIVNENANPVDGIDPLATLSRNPSITRTAENIINFEGPGTGTGGSCCPSDPSGAIGLNHYVSAQHNIVRISNRQGTQLMQGTIDSFTGTNVGGGDPIIMYDRAADRWFISQFDSPNSGNRLRIGISQTADPTGDYYFYTYTLDSFPDYPKYGIWEDSYVMGANKQGTDSFVFDRTKMLAGDSTAEIVGFQTPNITRPGFTGLQPVNFTGTANPLSSEKPMIVYIQDDAWAGITEDHIKIWEINIDWSNSSSASIEQPIAIPTAAFNSNFFGGFANISQPNTGQRIDAIQNTPMHATNYRNFGTHRSIALNFAVNIGNNEAAIRWIELRNTNDGWQVFQEGTYNPDDTSRFMGSMGIDDEGNIGMMYAVSSSSVFPGIRYTGRLASDPVGEMTVEETIIRAGTGSRTTNPRFGDYYHLTLDPVDNKTFWGVGEYFNGTNSYSTVVFAFRLTEELDTDEVNFNRGDFIIARNGRQNKFLFQYKGFKGSNDMDLNLYNSSGQLVLNSKFDAVASDLIKKELNLNHLSSGVYIAVIQNGESFKRKKIIIK